MSEYNQPFLEAQQQKNDLDARALLSKLDT
jgi:hypothetical protein